MKTTKRLFAIAKTVDDTSFWKELKEGECSIVKAIWIIVAVIVMRVSSFLYSDKNSSVQKNKNCTKVLGWR